MNQRTNHAGTRPIKREGSFEFETAKARQAIASSHVRYVLATSIVLVAMAFVTIYFTR